MKGTAFKVFDVIYVIQYNMFRFKNFVHFFWDNPRYVLSLEFKTIIGLIR
jgi:hypothetical protein